VFKSQYCTIIQSGQAGGQASKQASKQGRKQASKQVNDEVFSGYQLGQMVEQ
jgi:hypothetical protein